MVFAIVSSCDRIAADGLPGVGIQQSQPVEQPAGEQDVDEPGNSGIDAPSETPLALFEQEVPIPQSFFAENGVTMEDEALVLRDDNSFTFMKDDGAAVKYVSSEALNYRDPQGDLRPINTILNATPTGFENATNIIASRFPANSSSKPIVIDSTIAMPIQMWTGTHLALLDANGKTMTSIASKSVPGRSDGSVLTYMETYPSIDERFRVQPGTIKYEVVIRERPNGIAEGAFLAFSENINLPEGYYFTVNEERAGSDFSTADAIEIRSETGEVAYSLAEPFAEDSNFSSREVALAPEKQTDEVKTQIVSKPARVGAMYFVSHVEKNIFRIRIAVPATFINDPARVFPIVVDPTTTYSTTPNAAISDYTWTTSNLAISDSGTINDVNAKVWITHTWDGDIDLYVRHPDATEVRVSFYNGSSGDNYGSGTGTPTVFDDEAATIIYNGSPPYVGSYRPENALSAFDGKNLNGTWQFKVYDNGGGDTGTLKWWALAIDYTVQTPSISSVTYSGTFYKDRGKQITINGSNLSSATAVKIGGAGGVSYASIDSNSSTQIVATFAGGAYANGDVYVATAWGNATYAGAITLNSRNTIDVGGGSEYHTTISSAVSGLYAEVGASAFTATKTISIYDNSGDFAEQVTVNTNLNPTASYRLVITEASSSENPVINATGQTFGIRVDNVDYVTIKGLEVKNASTDGIYTQGANLIITENVVHNNAGDNISIAGGGNSNEVSYNKVYSSSAADGIQINGSQSCNVHHNLSYSNFGDGIGLYTASSTTVENNTSYGNGHNTATLLTEGFESGTTGWTLGSDPGDSDWRRQSGQQHTGSWDCAVYDLGTSTAYDYYWDASSGSQIDLTRTIDLTGYTTATLSFWWRCGGETPSFDYGQVLIDSTVIQNTMNNQYSYTYQSGLNLNAYCGSSRTLKFRFIADTNTGSAPGFCVDDIVITGTGPDVGSACYIDSGSGYVVTNNIFQSKGATNYYATYVNAGASISASSGYNDQYSSGSKLCYYNGTDCTTLSSWNTAQPGSDDISADPYFVNPGTDFHVKASGGSATYAGGSWPPTSASGGTWTAYAGYDSPCVDAGTGSVGSEPSPNGSIRNLGCYGGTVQATKSVNMNCDNVTVSQASTGNVTPGNTDKEIISLRLSVSGTLSPLTLASIVVKSGCTSDADVAASGVKLYWTGSSAIFSTTTQLGSGGDFSSGSVTFSSLGQALSNGYNYVWVVFDVSYSAVAGNVLDAYINAASDITVTGDGDSFTLTTGNPAGSRAIQDYIEPFDDTSHRDAATTAAWSTTGYLKAAPSYSTGTGADGAYSKTSGGPYSLAAGTYNYTSFTIASGVTVNVTGSGTLTIYVQGAVDISGTLNLKGGNGGNGYADNNSQGGSAGSSNNGGGGAGGAGGYWDGTRPGGNGSGTGAGTGGSFGGDDAGYGGGGGGHGTAGSSGSGGGGGSGGSSHNNTGSPPTLIGGGGGGGGADEEDPFTDESGGGGGAGGGAVAIYAGGSISASGTINANGGTGGNGGSGESGTENGGAGGGGAGGAIFLLAGDALSLGTNSTQVSGGSGGSGGHNGGAGGRGVMYLADFGSTFSATDTHIEPNGYSVSTVNSSATTTYGYSTAYDFGTGLFNWLAPSMTDSAPGSSSIAYEYAGSTDAVAWSGWTSTITTLNGNSYRYLKFKITLTSTSADSPYVDDITFPVEAVGLAGLWDGSTSTDWNLGANWANNSVPNAIAVTIPGALSNYPNLTAAATNSVASVTIQSGGQVTLSTNGSVIVTGNLGVDSGGTLSFNGGNITVQGDITNDGTINSAIGGTLTMSGASAATITNSSSMSVYHLTINKNASATEVATSGNHFDADGNVTVTTGKLTLSAIDADYDFDGNLTVATGNTLNHTVNWNVNAYKIKVGGDLDVSGSYTYNTRGHINMDANGSAVTRYVRCPNGVSILTFNYGDFYANGTVSAADDLWAMFNSTGTFRTNGNTVSTSTTLVVSGGTFYANGGAVSATNTYIGYSASSGTFDLSAGSLSATTFRVGGAAAAHGTVSITGGTLTCTDYFNGYNKDANGATTLGAATVNVLGDFYNRYDDTGTSTNTFTMNNASSVLDIGDAFTNKAGATFTMSASGNTYIAGAYVNAGTMALSSGTMTFDGSSAQSVTTGGVSANEDFSNVTINNAAGVSTTGAIKIDGTLTISSGNFAPAASSDFYSISIGASGTFTPAGDVTVSGSWSNSGTFAPGTYKVTFDGSVGQAVTTGGTGAGKSFFGVTVANTYATPDDSNDVDTTGGMKVAGTLTIADGQFSPATGSDFQAVDVQTSGILKPDADASIVVGGSVTVDGQLTLFGDTVSGPTWAQANGTMMTVSDTGYLKVEGTSAADAPTLGGISGAWDLDISDATGAGGIYRLYYAHLERCTVSLIGKPVNDGFEYVWFDSPGATGDPFLDFTQSTYGSSVWTTFEHVYFDNTSATDGPKNIKADSGTCPISVFGEWGDIGGEQFDDDPAFLVNWYAEGPSFVNEDTGDVYTGAQALEEILTDVDTINGNTVTQVNTVPLYGATDIDYSGLPTGIVLNRMTIFGDIDFSNAGSYTLQNGFVFGNVGATNACANVYHCSVDGTIDATTAKWNLGSGVITATTKEDNRESATLTDFVGSGALNMDLHLDLASSLTTHSTLGAVGLATNSTVAYDYDGETRPAVPSIGADEIVNSSSNVGQILWKQSSLSSADSMGPVMTTRWDSSGTNLMWLGTGTLDSTTPRWQNGVVAVSVTDGSVYAGIRGAISAGADNNAASTEDFPAAWTVPGPVCQFLMWPNRSETGADNFYDIFIAYDADSDGKSDSVRKIAIPYLKTGGLSAANLRFSEATIEWTYSVSEGPLSFCTFNIGGNNDICFIAESHSGGAWGNSNPVAIMINNDDGAGASYGAVKDYHQRGSAPHYDYRYGLGQYTIGSFFAALKSDGSDASPDIAKLDGNLDPVAELNVTDGASRTLNGIDLPPTPGPYSNMGRVWLTSNDVDHFFLVESNLSGVVSPFDPFDLSDESVTESTGAAMTFSPRSYFSGAHVFGGYTENGRHYFLKVQESGDVDPDWAYDATPPSARDSQELFGDICSGGFLYNRLEGYLWIVTDGGQLFKFSCPNVSTTATADGVLSSGFPLRLADSKVNKVTYIFQGNDQVAILFLENGTIQAVRIK
ncbi:MAG: proprotein convertase P-domain-containing protein [Planctomycetes bacterium]|nr:proprotein convertase P-domain-containing protein [Planctomycetota bacterium]